MAKFCPECGKPTIQQEIGGRVRACCADGHFVEFANTPMSTAALVFKGDSVLLVQHNHPTKIWSLPGGYLEQEEDLGLALIREVKEESNVDVQPLGIIALRQLVKETRNEFYIIFLAEVVSDVEPRGSGDEEILDAKFVAFADLEGWHITPFTRRIIAGYLAHQPEPLTSFTIPDYMPIAYMFGNI